MLGLIVWLIMAFCWYKIWGYFFAWVEQKWGKESKGQVGLLAFILILSMIFAFGDEQARQFGYVILVLGSGVIIGGEIYYHFLKKKLRQALIKDYLFISMELHKIEKTGWTETQRAKTLYDLKNQIWSALDPPAHEELNEMLPVAIKQMEENS